MAARSDPKRKYTVEEYIELLKNSVRKRQSRASERPDLHSASRVLYQPLRFSLRRAVNKSETSGYHSPVCSNS